MLSLPANTNPLKPPKPEILLEATTIVQEMIANPRGPYLRIRWFCNDGTIHPPQPYACKERDGGHQHAEYSDSRKRLAELGWHVGTIFTATTWEELWSPQNRNQRLRELALERYLIEIDDGWVMRRAKNYRGHVQLEDEEYFGHQLLTKLLQNSIWLDENLLLALEMVSTIPHNRSGEDLTRSIRRGAQNLSEKDPEFENLRIEIHSSPTNRTASHIRNWIERNRPRKKDAQTLLMAEELADQIDVLYGDKGRQERLSKASKKLIGVIADDSLGSLFLFSEQETPLKSIQRVAHLLERLRILVISPVKPDIRLLILDTFSDLVTELRINAEEFLDLEGITRREFLQAAMALLNAAYSTGFLTQSEFNDLNKTVDQLLQARNISAQEYALACQKLSLASQWASGTVRYTFAEPLASYTALDPRAARFVDDTLRSSVLFHFAKIMQRLSLDSQNLAGIQHTILGKSSSAVLGLNPGIAVGRLRDLSDDVPQSEHTYTNKDIVLLSQSTSELTPVAGVLTYGEGNLLSHIQLLARNFGIPNVSLSATDETLIKPHAGQDILLIVGSEGSVFIQALDQLSEKQRLLIDSASAPTGESYLEVPSPDLSVDQPILLADLHKELSGKVVGPKAANLGELNRLFPGKVAPAVALPFGLFAAHVNTDEYSVREKLREMYAASRSGALDDSDFQKGMEALRTHIAGTTLNNTTKIQLTGLLEKQFGPSGSYGVFIRSDTNVEDLAGFTGAGLSETIPHVVGLENQFSTIPQVWASVLSPRAIAWRSNLLKQPEEVYASVLLMKSVPSDKSGVMVTRNLFNQSPGLTISTAWGVGGAVAGEAAETIVLLEDGSELTVSEAKTPYQRILSEFGGIQWRSAPLGQVLTETDKQLLRTLAQDVALKYSPAIGADGSPLPWDIEFGFVNDELTLFQIRPLVEKGQARADRLLEHFQNSRIPTATEVELNAPL